MKRTACVVIVIILLLTWRIIAALQFTGQKCSLFAGSSPTPPDRIYKAEVYGTSVSNFYLDR